MSIVPEIAGVADDKDPYVGFLSSRRDQLFHLKAYPGNSGDALIRMGTETLLSRLGIRRTVDPRKADVILYPGGNPTMWVGNLEVWKDCWSDFPKTDFVVGPATFQPSKVDWASLIRDSSATVVALFARDPDSHRVLKGANLPPSILIGLGHDPALQLQGSEWLSEHRAAATEEYDLASFRQDHESAIGISGLSRLFEAKRLPLAWRLKARRQRRWLSARVARVEALRDRTLPLKVQDASLLDFESFVECVRRCRELHTDRLHAMLLAALLGKRVCAYPTAYGKLEGVYHHSLRSWADVRLVG